MASPVDQAIARFDEVARRMDGRTGQARDATLRHYGRTARTIGRKVANIGIALGALIAATIAFALIQGPIGISGLFVVVAAAILILIVFSMWSGEPKERPFTEQMSNREVVQTLDSFLVRRRTALPSPAARQVDAISAQLPLLESRLAEADVLDPLAQDARRLMGRHLPELIERYQRVPEQYRAQRDGDGLSVDERLVQGLGAAKQALDDLGAKLAHEDLNAFETQGRFIESRYKDEDRLGGA